ncbi:sigma-54-dependent Fis family transcriptional regulator [Halobacillus sp. Marseille-Q1614]|uniref:sigma-54-dependent Fis family transcriptional regulator n=1 Tax=Halobacillus sp. Marseille-Q1614 TaxID=2709134 RepID=UPI00156DA0C8|nr:sigma-54-dependent Fis family transcriptional regulator [Halobacillus sp. Marseille-Q1614]
MLDQTTKGDWKRFVQEGVLDESRINERIAASWNHCKQLGVDPYNGKGNQLLSLEELRKRRKENSRLMKLAEPFMKKLEVMYQDSNVVLLLIDREGYVLRMAGEKRVKAFAEDINFREGVQWTEEQVGTNAIGTALAIGESICIKGVEHFSVASQNWSCSASPIKDENGEVMGVLDISSPYIPDYHDHLLATVVSAAYAIETDWKNMMKEEELALINYGIKEEREGSDSFILYNRSNRIVYKSPAVTDHLPEQFQGDDAEFPKEINKFPVLSGETNDIIGHRISWTKKQLKEPAAHRRNTSFTFQGAVGKSHAFQSVLKRAEKAVHSSVTIHISGETGTGKEVMARSIHDSTNSKAPFVAVNCGALPENLLESELFGYVPGAFTDAQKGGYEGKIVQANGGTLFLDEMGDISLKTQVTLLRTLQEKQVVPLGGKKPIPVSFRLVTATNKNLGELVKNGTFREDLYYRIYVYPLHMPALRERVEDIPDLIRCYFQKRNWSFRWPDEAVKTLQNYHWPGNIRELFNVLEGVHTESGTLAPAVTQIESYIRKITPFEYEEREPADSLSYREQMEKDYIEKALKQHGGRVSAAAQQLNIPRSTFYRKLKKYKLDR